MARKGLVNRDKRREKGFSRLHEAATQKFTDLKNLNAAIDAKVSSAASSAEKLRIEANRVASRNIKAKMVAFQSHATTNEPGAGSCKGMFFDNGVRTNQVRGKEKIRKGPSAPRLDVKRSQYGKDL